MSKQFQIGSSSRHAQQRAFERSKLTCGEVDAMLKKKQFYWAVRPIEGRCTFALLFDVLSQSYLVAVVAPGTNCVKTLLTLEQFERTVSQVSPAAKMLARLALLSESKPKSTPVVKAGPQVDLTPAAWRFVAHGEADARWELPVLSHAELCETFCYVMPIQRQSELRRRASRVVVLRAFLAWFARSLQELGVPFESVGRLTVESLQPEKAEPQFSADITESFAQALGISNAFEQEAAELSVRHAARSARQVVRRKRQHDRRTQRECLRNADSTWVVPGAAAVLS